MWQRHPTKASLVRKPIQQGLLKLCLLCGCAQMQCITHFLQLPIEDQFLGDLEKEPVLHAVPPEGSQPAAAEEERIPFADSKNPVMAQVITAKNSRLLSKFVTCRNCGSCSGTYSRRSTAVWQPQYFAPAVSPSSESVV